MIKSIQKPMLLLTCLTVFSVAAIFPPVAKAERIWFDGTRDKQNGPPGKLLSDNAWYWGEVVLTGLNMIM